MLSQQSLVGTLHHILVGYEDKPTGMQIAFYVTTLVIIGIGMKWAGRSHRPVNKQT